MKIIVVRYGVVFSLILHFIAGLAFLNNMRSVMQFSVVFNILFCIFLLFNGIMSFKYLMSKLNVLYSLVCLLALVICA